MSSAALNQSGRVLRSVLAAALVFSTLGVSASSASAVTPTKPEISASVVGGTAVGLHDYPALAAILFDEPSLEVRDRLACTGTVITRRWVLTAGHCSSVVLFGSASVQVGSPILGAPDAVTVPVDRAVMHRTFFKRGSGYDLSLFHLASPIDVPRSRLAEPGDQPLMADGRGVSLVGWGLTQQLGIMEPPRVFHGPRRARVTPAPIVSDTACAEVFREIAPHYFVPGTDLCAGSEGHNVCYGDSGGPVYATDPQGHLVQIGITSRGAGCATKLFPAIFTDVLRMRTWILRYTSRPCPNQFGYEDPDTGEVFYAGPLYVC